MTLTSPDLVPAPALGKPRPWMKRWSHLASRTRVLSGRAMTEATRAVKVEGS